MIHIHNMLHIYQLFRQTALLAIVDYSSRKSAKNSNNSSKSDLEENSFSDVKHYK